MQQDLPGLSETSEEPIQDSILNVLNDTAKSTEESDNLLILTPNQPLAQQLRQLRLSNLGRESSSAANIHVLSAWMNSSAQMSATKPIASDAQLKVIWRSVLSRELASFTELSPPTLVTSALSAWRSLKRYRVELQDLRNAEYGQLIRFSNLASAFEAELEIRGFTSLEQELEIESGDHANHNLIASPQGRFNRVVLYGFLEPSPPLILTWLKANFEKVDQAEYVSQPSEGFIHRASSADSELRAAASWAKSIYEKDNSARIGIVHTDLRDELNKVTRIVSCELRPQFDTITSGATKTPIPFSASVSAALAETGAIRAALGLLELNLRTIERSDARKLIHSPFWSCLESEYTQRANWDNALCQLRAKQIKTPLFRELLERVSDRKTKIPSQENASSIPLLEEVSLQDRLLSFSNIRNQAAKELRPLDWANLFNQQLHALGWPGEDQLEPESEAVTAIWTDVLRDFSDLGAAIGNRSIHKSSSKTLDGVSKYEVQKIDIGEALNLLQECCNTPRTNPSAAHKGVRMLDTIEGAANFSHLWITGLDSSRWPAPNAPNALLPISLQRKYQMPRSDAKAETALAKKLIRRISNAAKEVVFSYPDVIEDIQQRPTRLLPDLPALPTDRLSSDLELTSRPAPTASEVALESVDTAFAPALSDQERNVRGGAALLRTMTASPFDAFAKWRLGAEPLPDAIVGLDAAQRGTLVHEVLDRLWKQLETQANLKSLTEEDCQTLCKKTAQSTVADWQKRYGWLGKAHAELETSRLSKLVFKWLEFEIERQEFEVIHTEERLKAELGPLCFMLRIDRIDRLADGSLLLIDYKTGQNLSVAHWLDLPPIEPQLPLYAISLEDTPHAICFAQVRPDARRIIGLSENPLEKGFLQAADWQSTLQDWRSSLTELAADYANGRAEVYEKPVMYGYSDPFAPLHRFNEHEQLLEWMAGTK